MVDQIQDDVETPTRSEKPRKQIIQEYIDYRIDTAGIDYFDQETHSNYDDFRSYLTSKGDVDLVTQHTTTEQDKKDNITLTIRNGLKIALLPRYNLIENLKDLFNEKFTLDGPKETTLKNELKKKEISDLKNLLNSEKEQFKLLKSIGINDPSSVKKEAKDNILSKLNIDNSKWSSFNQDQKDILIKFSSSYASLNETELTTILNLFNSTDKGLILKFFVNKVSFKVLINSGIWNEDKLKEEIKKIYDTKLHNSITSGGNFLDDYHNLRQNLDNYFFDVDNLVDTDLNRILNEDTIKRQILNEINSLRSQAKEEDFSELYKNLNPVGENNSIHQSFIDFIKKDPSISSLIKDKIDKLQESNYLKITLNKEEKHSISYYKINQVDVGNQVETKTINFEDLTLNSGIKKDGQGTTTIKNYEEIYQLFKIASEQKSGITINFYEKEDFKALDLPIIVSDEQIVTKENLESKLDLLDPEGKGIKLEDTVFIKEDEAGVGTIPVEKVESNNVILMETALERYSFKDLYSIIKLQADKVKRKKKLKNPDETLSSISLDPKLSENYKKIRYKDKSLEMKIDDKSDKYEKVEYLKGNDNKYIHIESIDSGSIKYNFGEINPKSKEKEVKAIYYSTSFDQFREDVIDFEMKAESNFEVDESSLKKIPYKKSFFKSVFSGSSIAELLAGGKMFMDNIKNRFDRGTKLRAAKLALKIGKFLPKDMESDLKAMVDSERKKTMEELITSMKNLGTPELIQKIRDIITDKASEDYEIEAALFTVASKYGELYPKGLSDLRGTYIWYKRLGGKVNSDEFVGIRKKSEFAESGLTGKKDTISFTENKLIYSILKDQGEKGLRRSRIEKEFEDAYGEGIKKEMEDGLTKTGNKFSTKEKIDYVLGEIAGGTFANGIGGIEKIFSKNTDKESMHLVPFVIASSGISTDLPEPLLNKLVGGLGFGTPYFSLFFCKSAYHIKLYQDFIKEIIKDQFPKDPSQLNKYNDLIKEPNLEKKIKGLRLFWEQNAKKLLPIITIENPHVFLKKEENPVYKEVYDLIVGIQTDREYIGSVKDENIQAEWYTSKNSIGYIGSLLSKIECDSGGSFRTIPSQIVFNAYLKQIRDIKNIENNDDKKKAFKRIFSVFEKTVRLALSSATQRDGTMLSELKNNGLQLFPGSLDGFSGKQSGEYAAGWDFSDEYNDFLENTFNKFKNHNPYSINSVTGGVENVLDTILDGKKPKADND